MTLCYEDKLTISQDIMKQLILIQKVLLQFQHIHTGAVEENDRNKEKALLAALGCTNRENMMILLLDSTGSLLVRSEWRRVSCRSFRLQDSDLDLGGTSCFDKYKYQYSTIEERFTTIATY